MLRQEACSVPGGAVHEVLRIPDLLASGRPSSESTPQTFGGLRPSLGIHVPKDGEPDVDSKAKHPARASNCFALLRTREEQRLWRKLRRQVHERATTDAVQLRAGCHLACMNAALMHQLRKLTINKVESSMQVHWITCA